MVAAVSFTLNNGNSPFWKIFSSWLIAVTQEQSNHPPCCSVLDEDMNCLSISAAQWCWIAALRFWVGGFSMGSLWVLSGFSLGCPAFSHKPAVKVNWWLSDACRCECKRGCFVFRVLWCIGEPCQLGQAFTLLLCLKLEFPLFSGWLCCSVYFSFSNTFNVRSKDQASPIQSIYKLTRGPENLKIILFIGLKIPWNRCFIRSLMWCNRFMGSKVSRGDINSEEKHSSWS